MGDPAARKPRGSAGEVTSMGERADQRPAWLYLLPGQGQVGRRARAGRPGDVDTPARTCQNSRLLECGVFPNN